LTPVYVCLLKGATALSLGPGLSLSLGLNLTLGRMGTCRQLRAMKLARQNINGTAPTIEI